MNKLISGLWAVAVIALTVVACAPGAIDSQSQRSPEVGEPVELSVVTDSSPEAFDTFPFADVSFGPDTWTGYGMTIDPPSVQTILWRPIDADGQFRHMVVFSFPQNRSCVAFYDEAYESLVTAELLSEAIATCYDVLAHGRANGMIQAGSELDAALIDRYAKQIVLECGTDRLSYNWFNDDVPVCELPSGRDSADSP